MKSPRGLTKLELEQWRSGFESRPFCEILLVCLEKQIHLSSPGTQNLTFLLNFKTISTKLEEILGNPVLVTQIFFPHSPPTYFGYSRLTLSRFVFSSNRFKF